jgi:hypothetical protein
MVTTRESFSRTDWSIDPTGGPTVGTKDRPMVAFIAVTNRTRSRHEGTINRREHYLKKAEMPRKCTLL